MLKSLALFLACGAVFVLAACSGGNATTSASKPTLQILAPAYGSSVVEGDTVQISSVATDATGVMRVELYVDGQLAKTTIAPDPKGVSEFKPVLEWIAAKPGAHTLVVRAFNAANASGDATIALAVNPRTDAPTPAGDATTISEITPVPSATTMDNTSTDVPATVLPGTVTPSPTTEVTIVAPTETSPARPTATLPPFAFQPPSDGGMSLSVNWSDSGLQLEAQANDVAVGDNNGDGIAYVEFDVQDLDGSVIATKRVNSVPYCYFGKQNGECDFAEPGTKQFVWAAGKPIRAGWYLIRAVSFTPDNRIQVAESPVHITMPVNTLENVFVNLDEPQTDRPAKELTFEVDVSGAGTGSGVKRIEMSVAAYNGQILQARRETSARYCGFGGGDNGQPCPAYNFAKNGLKWPNGAPVAPTEYILRAVAYLNDGTIGVGTFVIRIDQVK